MKYYEVTAKCGHVGRNYYVLKTFAVKAANGRAAARIVRNTPRVKHHQKDAIKSVQEIDKNRYLAIIKRNQQDPYFQSHSIQELRNSHTENEIYMEERLLSKTRESKQENDEAKKVFNGKQMIRKPKHYIRNYDDTEGEDEHGIY